MRLLLDTHTLLWFTLGDPQLSRTARSLIDDPTNAKLVSPATFWEIAIKVSIGKLALFQTYEEFIDRGIYQNGFQILPIEPRHTAALSCHPSLEADQDIQASPLVGRVDRQHVGRYRESCRRIVPDV